MAAELTEFVEILPIREMAACPVPRELNKAVTTALLNSYRSRSINFRSYLIERCFLSTACRQVLLCSVGRVLKNTKA